MTAGLNLQLDIIRITDQADDTIGGAQPSGTVIYHKAFGRIKSQKPTQMLLEQGLEMPTIFTCVLQPGTLDVQQNDQVQCTYPSTSPHYNHRFIVIGVQHSSMTDSPRAFTVLTLRRFEKAHGNQYM